MFFVSAKVGDINENTKKTTQTISTRLNEIKQLVINN